MSDSPSSRDEEGTTSEEDSSDPTLDCDTRIAFNVHVDENVTDEVNVVAMIPRVLGTMEELATLSDFSEATKVPDNLISNDNTVTLIKATKDGVSTTRKECEVGKPELSKEKCEQPSFIVSGNEKNPASELGSDLQSDINCVTIESERKETSSKGVGSSLSSTTREAKRAALDNMENRLGSQQIRVTTHDKKLMRNFKVLMEDVILNEKKTNEFLVFFKQWLEKRLTRRGWVTKWHPEIKAICAWLQEKRNSVGEKVSKLRNIGTEMTKKVIEADAQWKIGQQTVSNLYEKMIVL